MNTLKVIVIIFIFSHQLFAQNPFEKFQFLIGNWQGVETGMAGEGIGFRTYSQELNENYIVQKNQSTFPISKNKPMGEVHRDFGVMSFNSNDSSIVFRQFHIEGFTNIYVYDADSSSADKFVFITREIENNPGNWIARTTWNKISNTEFTEEFDISMDGINFKNFLKNHWRKVK